MIGKYGNNKLIFAHLETFFKTDNFAELSIQHGHSFHLECAKIDHEVGGEVLKKIKLTWLNIWLLNYHDHVLIGQWPFWQMPLKEKGKVRVWYTCYTLLKASRLAPKCLFLFELIKLRRRLRSSCDAQCCFYSNLIFINLSLSRHGCCTLIGWSLFRGPHFSLSAA